MRTGLALPLALLAFSASAAAAPPRAGETILAGCRQGECGWLRVVRVEAAGAVPQGRLVRMVARRGTSVDRSDRAPSRSRVEWEAADRVSYAFCSTGRPAYAFEEDGALLVHFLDPFDPAGYQLASVGLYMRLCHGRAGNVPSHALLRRLGYRPGTRSGQVENGSTETMTRF